jgi:hypothetical protein
MTEATKIIEINGVKFEVDVYCPSRNRSLPS